MVIPVANLFLRHEGANRIYSLAAGIFIFFLIPAIDCLNCKLEEQIEEADDNEHQDL
jgi:hypothetical protein